ncbi:hypothetical protein OHA40_03840 [Nocardia sp. NBC_00508]|uniref:hypothetical protein n=1 Tax=Nocardia sp. NBC_00508 TaxID=2975992 RepID=UPI002E81852D|nr:hypothetical protein [Nocardia sp. NBC_00508]WUD67302.1 hypothetical protein OHA40_03840 [Nocardia sp. NBC_00508]
MRLPFPVIRLCGLTLLAGAGALNAVPVLGAVSPEWAESAYGVGLADIEVLMRHRGVLFAIVGGGLLVAVARPRLRVAAVTANAVSYAGFVLIAVLERPISPELARIARYDVAGLVALAMGTALVAWSNRRHTGNVRPSTRQGQLPPTPRAASSTRTTVVTAKTP